MNFKKLFSDCFAADFETTKQNFLSSIPNYPKSYSEIYFESSNSFLLEFVNGDFITDSASNQSGYSLRQIENQYVSFDSFSTGKGNGLQSFGKKHLLTVEPFETPVLSNLKRRRILQKAESKVLANSSLIEGLAFKWQTHEKFITIINNKEFSDFKIESLATLSINLKIKKHGKFYEGKAALSATDEKGSFTTERITGLIKKALLDAENKSTCVHIQPGGYDIVFASGSAGLVFHELVGHMLESDYVTNQNTLFKNCIGEKIANEQISIVDACANDAIVNYKFDDDGHEATETVLVENGILKNYLSDRYHEQVYKIKNSGNGRRKSYKDLPLPRMGNTLVSNGKFSIQEILKSVDSGLYVTDPGNGTVNTLTGDFTFANVEGFVIENGIITKSFNNLDLSGNVKEALKNIDMVGNDFSLGDVHADCIKENQIIQVGFGAPTLKIKYLSIR